MVMTTQVGAMLRSLCSGMSLKDIVKTPGSYVFDCGKRSFDEISQVVANAYALPKDVLLYADIKYEVEDTIDSQTKFRYFVHKT